jgi:hypothetical protein
MRNLLGRLHARPPEELARIADFWQVPLTSGDRHAMVATLYRALSDPRAVRAVWDRLDADERDLVRWLALSEDEPPTLADLATSLQRPLDATRQIAARLYRVGILVREGDDEPLPLGAVPRLFLPRELALLFRRVQDEIEAGDLSTTPLRALLALLDDAEIEEAAEIWGLRVIPGLRQRDELSRRVLRQVADPDRIAGVAAKRRGDAARIWNRLRAEADNAPVSLADAATAAELNGPAAAAGQRLRRALAELETALLVWHTYRPDGSRWLFIPAEIRAPRSPDPTDLPPLQAVAEETLEPVAWRHPDALAWDLLTLLRELTASDLPVWHEPADLPRAWLRRLNGRLWNRDADVPTRGYLDLLLSLAVAEGLLDRPVDRDGATDRRVGAVTLAPGLRRWRDRSFADQTGRLIWWWLDNEEWVEGAAADAVEVWGADWRGARRKLLGLLAGSGSGLEMGVWYALDSVTARIAALDPDLLGTTFTVASARQGRGADDEGGREAAIAQIAGIALETAFAWFGLVDLTDISGHARAVRVNPAAAALAAREARPDDPAVDGPPLTVSAEGAIDLHAPTPLRVWSLSAFAEPERLAQVSRYRLSADAVARALAAGFEVEQIAEFLARQSGAPLPPELADRLGNWARGYRRVRLQRAVILTPDDRESRAALERIGAGAGFTTHALGDDAVLLELPPPTEADPDPEERMMALLRANGHAPQRARGHPPLHRRDDDALLHGGGPSDR